MDLMSWFDVGDLFPTCLGPLIHGCIRVREADCRPRIAGQERGENENKINIGKQNENKIMQTKSKTWSDVGSTGGDWHERNHADEKHENMVQCWIDRMLSQDLCSC